MPPRDKTSAAAAARYWEFAGRQPRMLVQLHIGKRQLHQGAGNVKRAANSSAVMFSPSVAELLSTWGGLG